MKRLLALCICWLRAQRLAHCLRTPPICRRTPGLRRFTKRRRNLPYDWNGFYLGINGGYNFGQSSWSDPAAGADSGKFSTKGGLLGGQVGYNWQVGKTVLGVESDIDWTKTSGTASGGVCATDGGGQCESKQSWFGTTRARLGYAFDRFLPYITGGAAYGDVKAVQPSRHIERHQARLGRRRGHRIRHQ